MGKTYAHLLAGFKQGKKIKIFLHLTVWIIILILPAYLIYLDDSHDTFFLNRTYMQILLYAFIFYVNYLWLTPKLFFRGKKVLYFIVSVLLVGMMTFINELTFKAFDDHPHNFQGQPTGNQFRPDMGFPGNPPMGELFKKKSPPKSWPMYNFILTTLFISGFGMGLCFSDKLMKNEKERKEAEKEKLNTELAFLKNQINPHFFFNTLNNIYSLVQISVEDGQKAILHLSKLMRYLLYETESGDKLLSQEIDFIQTYIELMRLRISEKVQIEIQFPEEYKDFSLPPLLFLPFIENAFKHGISYRRQSYVKIHLDIIQEMIVFECSNSIGNKGEDLVKSDYGIGLENVKKRLNLIYPAKHKLTIDESETEFSIYLTIDIPKAEV
ncbi:MAG: histidine kinase [Bacteroidetes bacterium]|nr:histidine kinase [Bacteroidota bacterium]